VYLKVVSKEFRFVKRGEEDVDRCMSDDDDDDDNDNDSDNDDDSPV